MILDNISALSILLPALVAGITFYWQTKTLRKLSVFVFATLILEISAAILSSYHTNNMWIFHLYTLLEVVFIAWIYNDLSNNRNTKIVNVLLVVFIMFSAVNIICIESLKEFNSYQRFIGGVTIIIYALIYFVQLFKEAKIERLERHAYFWLNSAFLIYFAGTLFLFILTENILADDSHNYWNLHAILNISLNLGYTATLWMGVKKLI
ncbi:MAG: hypothetical protein ACI837_000283 [Crocinitomicaceae bacterium]